MSLNSKILNEILEITEKYFICLRCAECCFRWAVPLPEGVKKPENYKCPHLIDIYKNENKLEESICKIYEVRPEVCKNFKISFATVCPIGLWKWLKLKESEPDIELPERVKKILEILEELK
ncbi:MAG: hypothetical protein NZ809_02485 [Thermodesulfovibrio sp.]|nr:hypothetical protein [Thermodesulfovibrio sp.]